MDGRRGPGGAPLWLWWTVGAIVLLALTLLVWRLVDDDAAPAAGATAPGEAPAEDAAQTPPADVSASPTTGATASPTAPATEPPADPTTGEPPAVTMPLKGPQDSRFVDGVSAIPTTPQLPDGDYFAHLTGVDTAARTVTFDVQVMYVEPAASAYLLAEDPTAEIPPPNGFVIVNASATTRTLPLADDVRIWDWCSGGPEALDLVERPLAEWAAAPANGDTTCGLGAALSHGGNEVYWFDVRAGVVEQVVGQYLP